MLLIHSGISDELSNLSVMPEVGAPVPQTHPDLRKPQTKETTEEKPKESGGLLDEEEGLGGLGRSWEG